jgi:predicted peptidase
MSYQYLMPSGYSGASAYPLVLYLHQLDNASQIPSQIDPWFNNVTYRTDYPSIVVAPQCDMTADPSGNTINWGGVSSDDQPCQDNAIALVRQFMASYSVYAPKVYVTGNSMGGIGSWDAIIKYNTKAPTVAPLFAAALILAGATYDWGYPTPNASVVTALASVPIWAIHGANDTQVPLAWDEAMYAAQQAQGGRMQLLIDPNLAHDVWDTYYVVPTSQTYWTWLFAQGG